MSRILITGGAGYIGSVLTPALLGAGHDVVVLDNFLFRQFTLADCCGADGFEVVRGDCRDETLVARLLASVEIIIPLAGLVGAPLCDRDRVAAVSVNRDAVRLLCRHASPSQRIIIPTTNSGYGSGGGDRPCDEETPLRPISLYASTKAEAEQAVLDHGAGVTLRLATLFGMSPRMRLDLLVNDFVHRAVHDRAVVVFEGGFRRNFLHVRDAARAFLFAIDHFDTMCGQPFNVGLDDANLSKLELCRKIQEHVPGFVYVEAPIGEDPDKRDYIVSSARIARLGFRPEWSLDRGIRELIKGYTILADRAHSNV
jgi:nucleoside-diphosphate-sugar epimerase